MERLDLTEADVSSPDFDGLVAEQFEALPVSIQHHLACRSIRALLRHREQAV